MNKEKLEFELRDIAVCGYELRAGARLNTRTQREEYCGALLRWAGGYGCVHPWPEFGDEPLCRQLELLRVGRPTALVRAALECARVDGAARAEGRSLFAGLEIPRSHYSWSGALDLQAQVQRVMSEGWPAIKVKGDADPLVAAEKLNSLAQATASAGTLLRMDFNGCLDAEAFRVFWRHLDERTRARVDFVEDPVPYDAGVWEKLRGELGVRLALDKGWQSGEGGFDVVVVKPSRRDWRVVANRFETHELVMTSAMDHAVGQAWAAYQSAVARKELGPRLGLCGLCTEHLFEQDACSLCLRSHGGTLVPDTVGGGLGMGDVLESLKWVALEEWRGDVS